MVVNSLPKTVTRQRRGCDFNPGPSAPASSTLTTRPPSHPCPYAYGRAYAYVLYGRRSRVRIARWPILAYLGVKFLDELRLTLLFVLIGQKLASVAAVLLIQATSELNVLLHHTCRSWFVVAESGESRATAALAQRRLQLSTHKHRVVAFSSHPTQCDQIVLSRRVGWCELNSRQLQTAADRKYEV